MQYKEYFAAGILFLFCVPLQAQHTANSYTVSGYVKDMFGKPLSGATITSKEESVATSTEADGFYRLSKLKNGDIQLFIHALGYVPQEQVVHLTPGKDIKQDFQLRTQDRDIDEVSVYGKSENQRKIQEVRQSGYAVNVIDMNEHAGKVADLNQVLRRSPGVTIRENGGMGSDFAFKINGLDAKIFIDGMPMESFGSSMTLNNIPVNLVDRVEVYKGVVPAYLATDVLGGAVNIITKRRNRHFFDFSYGYGSFNTHQASFIGNYRDPQSGLTIRTDAFLNHSDNSYTMYANEKYGVSLDGGYYNFIDEESGIMQHKLFKVDKAKRFHDPYTSGMVKMEAGFDNVSWADRFMVGATYSKNKDQSQMGSTINGVYGGRWSENGNFIPSVQYRKNEFIVPDLFVNAFANYSGYTTLTRDTAQYEYRWAGTPYATTDGTRQQEHKETVRRSFVTQADFGYNLNSAKTQVLSWSYNLSTEQQTEYDRLEQEAYQDITGLPSGLNKHLINLSWQGDWLDKKLTSVLFFKYYGMDISNTMDLREYNSEGVLIGGAVSRLDSYNDYKGAGVTLRYLFQKDFGIKTSVERAYRLPTVEFLYGDGRDLMPNQDLKPERSDNYNLGTFYNAYIGDSHFVNFDLTGFFRNAQNYFLQRPIDNKFQYQNVPGAWLYGIEVDARYGYKDMFRVNANLSYDKAAASKKYTDDTKQEISLVYKEQLPNRPWMYGNLDISVGKNNLLGDGTRIELNYTTQYTRWFYLSWASLGDPGTKNYVPTQYVHGVNVSYSWKHNRYGISLEARNFTNELAYDNFRLQKPGRAFYTKLRMSIL